MNKDWEHVVGKGIVEVGVGMKGWSVFEFGHRMGGREACDGHAFFCRNLLFASLTPCIDDDHNNIRNLDEASMPSRPLHQVGGSGRMLHKRLWGSSGTSLTQTCDSLQSPAMRFM